LSKLSTEETERHRHYS